MTQFGRRQSDFSNRVHGAAFGRRREDFEFDQSPFLLAVVSADFRLKVINVAWEKGLGHARSEMLARPLTTFVTSDEHVSVHRLLNPRSIPADDSQEFSLRCKDGTYRCFSWSRRPALAERVVLIVGKDVTERKKLETTANLQALLQKYRSEKAR